MKGHILISILTFFSLQIFGQQKLMNFDTLIINVNERITVKISSYENGWLKYYDGFSTRIDKFKEDLSKIQNEIPNDSNLLLASKNIGELAIEIRGDIKNYKTDNEISYTRHNEAYISSDKYNIFIYFNKLNDLLTTDIQACVNRAVNNNAKQLEDDGWVDYYKRKHHPIAWTITLKCANDTTLLVREKSHYNANKQQLKIRFGAGAGIVQNQISTDFSFRAAIFDTKKGILKSHKYISTNLYYMFDQNNSVGINTFLNFGYQYNLSNQLDKYDWIGLEIGYLIKSDGDFFQTPTFRLGTIIDLKHKITLSPHIYFEDGFNKVYPGIRIGIDLGL